MAPHLAEPGHIAPVAARELPWWTRPALHKRSWMRRRSPRRQRWHQWRLPMRPALGPPLVHRPRLRAPLDPESAVQPHAHRHDDVVAFSLVDYPVQHVVPEVVDI